MQHLAYQPQGQPKRRPAVPGRIRVHRSLSFVPVPENQQTSEHRSGRCETLAKPCASPCHREFSAQEKRFGPVWVPAQQPLGWPAGRVPGAPPSLGRGPPRALRILPPARKGITSGGCLRRHVPALPTPAVPASPALLCPTRTVPALLFAFFFSTAAARWAEASAEPRTETPGPCRGLMQ